MTTQQNVPESRPDLTEAVRALRCLLAAQLEGHRRLRGCLQRQRAAIRAADVDALSEACREAQDLSSALGDAEQRRLDLVVRLSRRAEPAAAEPLALDAIAAFADGPEQEALLGTASALRDEPCAVRRESSIVTTAAGALSRHLAGIRQTMAAALSRVGVYERRGRIAEGSQMDFCIDLRT